MLDVAGRPANRGQHRRMQQGQPHQQRHQDAHDRREDTREPGDTLKDYLLVPGLMMQLRLPAVVMFAFYLLLRGHNLPGGGFAAGITLSIALIIQYMAMGTRFTESRLTVQPLRWAAAGLLCALLTGVGSWFFGLPFLTSDYRYVSLPLIGPAPLSTAMLFDIGVFALVVGATVLILIALAHQSLRTPRRIEPPKPSPSTVPGNDS